MSDRPHSSLRHTGGAVAPDPLVSLSAQERMLLAALAVVGHATLSQAQLAEIADVDEVAPLLANLEARGLVRRDEQRRYGLLGGLGERLRATDETLASADRLLRATLTLARGDALSLARLPDDVEAILGLSRFAAEHRQWAQLLELVRTLQAAFAITHRVEQWLVLLQHARTAAEGLGTREAEIWVLEQLSAAAAALGDGDAAARYARDAEAARQQPPTQQRFRGADRSGKGVLRRALATAARPALWTLGVIAAGVAGVAAGLALADSGGRPITTELPVTVSVGGKTVTVERTVTLPERTVTAPAQTLTTTETVTSTETVTTTETITTAPPIR